MKKKNSTDDQCTVRSVLSGHPLGMAYWPFNTGLTNMRVIQENKGSQRVKYLSHDKLISTRFYPFLGQKKKVKEHSIPYTVWPVALVRYLFSNNLLGWLNWIFWGDTSQVWALTTSPWMKIWKKGFHNCII